MVYRKQKRELREFEDFHLSFGGRLSSDSWVRLAKLIPWDQIEVRYAVKFRSRTGPPALIARIAVGSLITKEKLQLSDEETVEQIRENPYLQYFLGYKAFTDPMTGRLTPQWLVTTVFTVVARQCIRVGAFSEADQ
jgi:transposase, IS5 family